MKTLLLIISFSLLFLSIAHAETKELVYDGKEIYLHVKKDHLITVIFPEAVVKVIRGFSADSYVIQRNDKMPNTLELLPVDSEIAELTVTGVSGEVYVLRCVASENFYTKLIIRKITLVDKANEKVISTKIDALPETVRPSKDGSLNLPPELNQRITLKGNNLPLKIYLSTISQVTGLNVITTPDIDSQKTSVNLDNIEVWRALKSLLYKFGYGFKVSEDDLIITETETRIFNVSMPAVDQSFTDETSNESNGQVVSVASYQNLYNTIGSIYDVPGDGADGVSTFAVPDLMGRTIVGVDAMGGVQAANRITLWGASPATMGGTFGESAHTLAMAELPASAFNVQAFMANGSHQYGIQGSNNGADFQTASSGMDLGNGVAHNVVQPSIAMGYIIKY